MSPLRVDVVIDLICPWCFIGKRRLEEALAQRPGMPVEMVWRPFELNPALPPHGMAWADYAVARMGGVARAERLQAPAKEAAARLGIEIDFSRIARLPNTLRAHRLVQEAARHNAAGDMVERLFQAYFCEARDIGDPDCLVAVAEEAALDGAAIRALLDDQVGAAELRAEENRIRRLGVNAVPCFVFAGQYAIAGAQEAEFFQPLLDLAAFGEAASF